MSVSILTNNRTSPNLGHLVQLPNGKFMHYGVAKFNGTSTSGFLPTGPLRYIEKVAAFLPIGQVATAKATFQFPAVEFASISATTVFELPPSPVAGTVTTTNFTVSTTVATHASNIWTIGVVNKTQTQTVVDSTAAINSNNSTGGQAFTANTSTPLTIGGGAAIAVAVGDVLEVTLTKAASAANLVEFAFGLNVSVTATTVAERIELNESSTVDTTYGTFKVNQNGGIYSLALSRPSTPTPTTDLCFYYEMIGY